MTEKAIVITTDNKVDVRDLEVKDNSLLEALQGVVGGYIETVSPMRLSHGLLMIVNEEGVILDLPVNIIASILYGADLHGTFIYGDVAIVDRGYRNGEPDLEGIPPLLVDQLLDELSKITVI